MQAEFKGHPETLLSRAIYSEDRAERIYTDISVARDPLMLWSLNFQIIIRYFNYFFKKYFCLEKYIGFRSEIKLLHSFRGQLK